MVVFPPRRHRGWLTSHRTTARALTLAALLGCKPGTVVPPGEKMAEEPAADDANVEVRVGPVGLDEPARERQRPPPEPVSSLDAAYEAIRRGNPEGAVEFLGPFVADHPDDTDARLSLARALLGVGNHAKAVEVLSPPGKPGRSPAVAMARARALGSAGKLDQEIATLEGLLKRDPGFLPARGELLAVLHATGKGKTPRARDVMESLYDAWDAGQVRTPDDFVAVAQATLARGSTGAFKDANYVLGEAEGEAPVGKGSWVADRIVLMRGHMFLEKYAGDEAAQTFAMLLERNPWHPDALAGMAMVHFDALRFAAASRAAHEALQVDPGHADAHAVLARIALVEGRRSEAREHARAHALARNPTHSGALAVLAAVELMAADQPAFRKWHDRALANNPHNVDYYDDIADVLSFVHLYGPLDELLADAVARNPDDPQINSSLAINLLRLGREKPALEALDRAWKRDKFNERTHYTLELFEQIDKDYTDVVRGQLSIRLPRADHDLVAPGLIAAIERARAALDASYGIKAGKLRLEFFSEPEQFSIRTTGVPNLGAAAVCFGHVITFTGPYRGTHNIDQVIWHELGHVYAIELSGGRVPRWFTEGLSEWETELADPSWARESAALLAAARRHGKLRGLEDLELAFIRAESPQMMEVAYSTAAYAVRYLGQTHGRAKLIEMLKAWGKGTGTDEVFRSVLGRALKDEARAFEAWFFAQLDAKVRGWEPSPARPGQGPSKLDQLFDLANQQITDKQLDESARTLQRLIHSGGDGYHPRMLLAGMLVDGPKPQAARRHLEKARRFHGEATQPHVLLARIASVEGDTPGEIGHLTRIVKLDAQAFGPAARLLVLALVTGDKDARALAEPRVHAIAPLHPLSLSVDALERAAQGKPDEAKKLLARTLEGLRAHANGPGEMFVAAALAASAVGDRDRAKILSARARRDRDLPPEALDALAKIDGKRR